MDVTDTIVAMATPRGKSAIGIVRLTGPEARRLAEGLLGAGKTPEHGRLVRRVVRDPATGEALDEGMVAAFYAPDSYTGDDLVEFHLHGSPVLLGEVLDLLLRAGARIAAPGEFTLRAFVNGKKDLSQAEAVHELVEARSVKGLKLAAGQVLGRVSDEINRISDELLAVAAALEAELDFPDDIEDMGDDELRQAVEGIARQLEALAASYDRAMTWREGFRVVLVGTPNVGKSSLFNALLGRERSIVTREAGTTRDFIEEFMPRSQAPVLLVDTAGIRPADCAAETAGVGLTRENVEAADLVLLLADQARPWQAADEELAQWTASLPGVVVGTKADLSVGRQPEGAPAPDLTVSTVTGQGVEPLRRLLSMTAEQRVSLDPGEVLVTSKRQLDAIVACNRTLVEALDALSSAPRDIVSSVVRRGLQSLGEVTGKGAVTDQVLEEIFSNFCIGK